MATWEQENLYRAAKALKNDDASNEVLRRLEQRYIEAWKKLGRPLPNYYEQVSRYSGPQPQNGCYRSHLRHALALDQYSSRDALLAATERYLFLQKLKSLSVASFKVMKKILGKAKKILIGGTSQCSSK